LCIGTVGLMCSPPAHADPVFSTTHNIQFSTTSDPGNPVVPQSVGPGFYFGGQPLWQAGSVKYEYRMARTEVTVAQWHEFITAYRPFYTAGSTTIVPFTSSWIVWSSSQQQYAYNPANADMAVNPAWRNAAAFANWYHNDKVNEAWAFQTGAYDTSSFGQTATGEITDQRERSPGARFWIPSHDEWIKAMHWDPDRHGHGQGGYWAYPHGSNDPPVPGVPGVGQTSGGVPLQTPPDSGGLISGSPKSMGLARWLGQRAGMDRDLVPQWREVAKGQQARI